MHRASFAALLIVTACEAASSDVPTVGVTDDTTATEALVAANDALDRIIDNATVEPMSATVRFTVRCDSGSATLTLDATEDASSSSAVYGFTMNACKLGDETTTGDVTRSTSTIVTESTTTIVLEIDGAYAYEGPTYAGNFEFNSLRFSYDVTGGGVIESITGTYSIGGTTYDADTSTALALF